ncbi:hypothetical protein BT69DRAFT_1354786 [Atractiella rhizophila]|nr:hypothetical protein BT69DRAFT_1354786 [Atractiella rhizophila]
MFMRPALGTPRHIERAEKEVRGTWVSMNIEGFMGMMEKSSPRPEAALSELPKTRQPIVLPITVPLQYDVVIDAMSDCLDGGWQQVNTSAHIDINIPNVFGATSVKPDILLYSPSRREAELFWEFKNGVHPFHDAPTKKETHKGKANADEPEIENDALQAEIGRDEDENAPSGFENGADSAVELRGQITLYNTVIQILQHRTRVFSIYIEGKIARLLCHSRAGTAVTSPFNYNEEPHLHKSSFRYTRSARAQRGHDDTTLDLRVTIRYTWLSSIQRATTSRNLSPTFTNIPSVATRNVSAYRPGLESLVLLKDIWRKMEYEKEGDALRKLNLANDLNVPTVLDDRDMDGSFQMIAAPYRQAMQHYIQVTDKIGRPLSSFTSSWEMVNAVCDAIRAHEAAWERTTILYRDISSGNILIYDLPSTSDDEPRTSQGLLIDWEMAKVGLSESFPRTPERTGTHQFLALELMGPDHIPHGPRHDLESFILQKKRVARKIRSEEYDGGKSRSEIEFSEVPHRSFTYSSGHDGAARCARVSLAALPSLHGYTEPYIPLGDEKWKRTKDAAVEYKVQNDREMTQMMMKIKKERASGHGMQSAAGSTKSSASRTRSRGGSSGLV